MPTDNTRPTHRTPITLDELLELRRAMQLIADTKEARKNGNMLEVVQPNGKRLGDCTGKECGETGQWLLNMAARLDSLNGEVR